MDIFGFLTLFGGLALFLYGMNIMGSGLEKFRRETGTDSGTADLKSH